MSAKNPAKATGLSSEFEQINFNAADIDVGTEVHFVAAPKSRDPQRREVRHCDTFTSDLYALVDWLKQFNIDTVAMESTGVFWIALIEILEQNGFEVKLCSILAVLHALDAKAMSLTANGFSNCYSG
jgi:hypothetical protein